jgi:ATP-dependent Clp protease ATP-binding subunit ClpC
VQAAPVGFTGCQQHVQARVGRGEIQCIGATTLDEYRQYIEKDGALERRFQKVIVEPTSVDETIQILNNIKEKYEDHHNVNFTDEAMEACVKLTNRYITDRHLPGQGHRCLDEAGSRVHISNIVVPKAILDVEAEDRGGARRKRTKWSQPALRGGRQVCATRSVNCLKNSEGQKKKWEEESKSNATPRSPRTTWPKWWP